MTITRTHAAIKRLTGLHPTGWLEFRILNKWERGLYAEYGFPRECCYGREFGLWYLTLRGFGLYFSVIGPFTLEKRSAA